MTDTVGAARSLIPLRMSRSSIAELAASGGARRLVQIGHVVAHLGARVVALGASGLGEPVGCKELPGLIVPTVGPQRDSVRSAVSRLVEDEMKQPSSGLTIPTVRSQSDRQSDGRCRGVRVRSLSLSRS